MAKKRTEAQLRKIMAAGFDARNELQERADVVANHKNAVLVGKWQKYRNTYGSDESWWMYRRVLEVNGQWCKCFTFQITSTNRVEVEIDRHSILERSGWMPVEIWEVKEAWTALLTMLSNGFTPGKGEKA